MNDNLLYFLIRYYKINDEHSYRFYSEELIDWGSLTEIQNLQIDLWETRDLQEVSRLRNLKRLGITKNVKSKV